MVLAQQILALYDLAPDRLRLGIGPSHRFIIEDIYGLQQKTPLAHLREYLEVLRAALWQGKVDHHGHFYNVIATLPRTSQIPILISTLGKSAFQLAGQIANGALSGFILFFSFLESNKDDEDNCLFLSEFDPKFFCLLDIVQIQTRINTIDTVNTR